MSDRAARHRRGRRRHAPPNIIRGNDFSEDTEAASA
jgi:hypothetical protein